MNWFMVPNLVYLGSYDMYGIHFFVNIGKFGLSYFREFATDFPETSAAWGWRGAVWGIDNNTTEY